MISCWTVLQVRLSLSGEAVGIRPTPGPALRPPAPTPAACRQGLIDTTSHLGVSAGEACCHSAATIAVVRANIRASFPMITNSPALVFSRLLKPTPQRPLQPVHRPV